MSPPRTWTRRALLGATGALLPLPWMASLVPRSSRAADEPRRRYVFYVAPNGMIPSLWRPAGDGPDWTPSELLEPLAPLKDQLTVLTGLSNVAAVRPEAIMDHGACTGSFLSCTNVSSPRIGAPGVGRSVDQILGDHLGGATPFRTLVLGSEAPVRCNEVICPRLSNVSWADATTPVGKDIHPSSVFERLFGASADPATADLARARRWEDRRSVLDAVLDQTAELRLRLSAEDRRTLDQYQSGLREVERRIDLSRTGTCEDPDGGAPALSNLDTREHVRAMHELMVLALQCDATRVVSYMIGNGQSPRPFDFLGYPDGHHAYTHQGSDVPLRAICRWEVEQAADLLQRLASVATPSGTLLDETYVLFGSEMGHGADHQPTDLPLVLAGGSAWGFVQGRHRVFANGTPLADLHLALLQSAGVEVDTFGDDGAHALLDLT